MRAVNIFTVQRPLGNQISISKVYKAFGENIPRYCPLEGDDFNGPLYMFCVDRTVDFETICENFNYRYYPAYKFEVEEAKYNGGYEIRPTYFNKEQPYSLEKYVFRYPDTESDEESK